MPPVYNHTGAQVMQLDEVMKPAQEIVSRFGLDLLVERGQARQACDEGVAANYPGNISSSLPQQHAPIEVTALTPSLGWRQEKEDEKNVASAVEKGEGVPERRFDSVEFSPPGTRDRPRSSQTVRGYERDERASVGKLVDRYERRGRMGIFFKYIFTENGVVIVEGILGVFCEGVNERHPLVSCKHIRIKPSLDMNEGARRSVVQRGSDGGWSLTYVVYCISAR